MADRLVGCMCGNPDPVISRIRRVWSVCLPGPHPRPTPSSKSSFGFDRVKIRRVWSSCLTEPSSLKIGNSGFGNIKTRRVRSACLQDSTPMSEPPTVPVEPPLEDASNTVFQVKIGLETAMQFKF